MTKTVALLSVLLSACFDGGSPVTASSVCTHTANGNPFVTAVPQSQVGAVGALPKLPASFAFGVATAAYQIEAGNHATDWAEWEDLGRIRAGEHADDGPQSDRFYAKDIVAMRQLGVDSYRLGIEWGRLFRTRADFDALRPDPATLLYYRALLEQLRAAGIAPMVTLQHFSLPIWLQTSQGSGLEQGLLHPEFPALLEKFAGFAAQEFGDLVDQWITINEPLALIAAGYAGGLFPPGRALDFDGMRNASLAVIEAHVRAYDALHGADRADADGDGHAALVSFATHNRLWLPFASDRSEDVVAAKRLRYINSLVTLDAVVCGNVDANWDEKWERVRDPHLRGKLDFIALNYYSTAAASAIGIEPVLGVPVTDNLPGGLPRSDVGWDLVPEGLRPVLEELAPYHLPIVITENGVADAADDRRPKNLIDTIAEIQAARRDGIDVRGYFHWSLVDNFEWATGFCPRFGLYAIDQSDPARTRTPRQSAFVYRDLIAARGVTDALQNAYPTYGHNRLVCERAP